MPLEFYKANPSVKGAACSFSFNSKDSALYVSIIKQVGWDMQRKVGSFKDGERCLLKFSISEIGNMIWAIERNKDFKTFHSNQKNKTGITFIPYIRDEVQIGFTFQINRTSATDSEDKSNFLVGFNFGELWAIREYLRFALTHIYSAIYSADKAAHAAREAEKNPTPAPAKRSKKQPEPEQEEPEVKTKVETWGNAEPEEENNQPPEDLF